MHVLFFQRSFDIPSSGQVTPQQAMSPDRSSPRLDPVKILSKYEMGEKGTLHRMYAEVMEGWLKHCHSLGEFPPSPLPHPPDRSNTRLDPVKILSKYEMGEKGTLHRMYAEVMEGWLQYCHSLGEFPPSPTPQIGPVLG